MFILNGGAVSWRSSKQSVVAKSSTEAEYVAASSAASEAVWMKEFLSELGVVPSASRSLAMYCDNIGAFSLAKEPTSHKNTKHIKRCFHNLCENVRDRDIEICKVHTDLNVADPLTKPVPRAKHDQHREAVGVRLLQI